MWEVDASTGRFISRDAVKDGRNWYTCAANSPVNCVDPDGNQLSLDLGPIFKHIVPPWLKLPPITFFPGLFKPRPSRPKPALPDKRPTIIMPGVPETPLKPGKTTIFPPFIIHETPGGPIVIRHPNPDGTTIIVIPLNPGAFPHG